MCHIMQFGEKGEKLDIVYFSYNLCLIPIYLMWVFTTSEYSEFLYYLYLQLLIGFGLGDICVQINGLLGFGHNLLFLALGKQLA